MEHAALAPVEGEHVRVAGDAREGLVDDSARDAGRLRIARHAGNERIEIAAAFCGRGRRGERDHDKERRNQSEHGRTLVAPAWSYTVIAGSVPCLLSCKASHIHHGRACPFFLSWPGIAVRRTALLRTPMSRPSTSYFQSLPKAWMPATSAGMTPLLGGLPTARSTR